MSWACMKMENFDGFEIQENSEVFPGFPVTGLELQEVLPLL